MGLQLTIIGMEVDVNKMTITMPEKSHADLLDAICVFAVTRTQHTLREFQKLGGWINCALNVWPLLCPSLCHLYAKNKLMQNYGLIRNSSENFYGLPVTSPIPMAYSSSTLLTGL
jgi:hypothetical protein